MDVSDASLAGGTGGRGLRILAVVATSIALSPVVGMLFFFAFVPAFPFMLALGFVIGRMHRVEDARVDEARSRVATRSGPTDLLGATTSPAT